MTLPQLVRIVLARKLLLALIICLGLVASSCLLLIPKQYEATATLIVDYASSDPVSNISLPAGLMDAYMSTQTSIASSYRVARQVVDDLHLASQPQLWRELNLTPKGRGLLADELAFGLVKHVRAETPPQSEILTVGYEAKSPKWAAITANAFVHAYFAVHHTLNAAPLGQAAKSLSQYLQSTQPNGTARTVPSSVTYDEAKSRYIQIDLKRISDHSIITILNPAIPPLTASSPKVLQNALLILFGCLLSGIFLVFALEMRCRLVRAAEDITDELNLPVLAIIK